MILPPKFGFALLLATIALPLIEIALLIKVASAIGGWMTLMIVLGTAALGVWLLQGQGLAMMRRMNEAARDGAPPVQPLIEGGLNFLSGWLLISPGLICDGIGLTLLVPPIRQLAARAIRSSFWPGGDDRTHTEDAQRGPFDRRQPPRDGQARRRSDADGPVIEGEWERIDERDVPSRPPPGRDSRGGS